MVDPFDITKYNRTQAELEELLLFCISVAGKNARVTSHNLERFLNDASQEFSIDRDCVFDIIVACAKQDNLGERLRDYGFGCWRNREKSFLDLVNSGIDLSTCSRDELLQIRGIGMKTASFFLLHSRPNLEIACLDVHILAYLRAQGYDVPQQSPSGKKYLEVEQVFLKEAKRHDMSIADFDLKLWSLAAAKI